MLWSFAYLVVRNLLALVVLVGRSGRAKELEILVLRHELEVLRVKEIRVHNRRRILPIYRVPAAVRAIPRKVAVSLPVLSETAAKP